MGCCIHVVGLGEAGRSVVDHMHATSNLACIELFHLKPGEYQCDNQFLKSDMLFIVVDPFIDNDRQHATELATSAKIKGILTLAICCFQKPAASVGDDVWQALDALKNSADALFVVVGEHNPHLDTEKSKEQVSSRMNLDCQTIVHSLTDLFAHKGMIAIDFADIRAIFEDSGYAALGVGDGCGEAAGTVAAASAINNLTCTGIDVTKAQGVSITISAHPRHCSLELFSKVMDACEAVLADDCKVAAGTYLDSIRLDDKVSVYLLATGLSKALL
jgi:cell division protein FtsZ